jgi:hypothetical protein
MRKSLEGGTWGESRPCRRCERERSNLGLYRLPQDQIAASSAMADSSQRRVGLDPLYHKEQILRCAQVEDPPRRIADSPWRDDTLFYPIADDVYFGGRTMEH